MKTYSYNLFPRPLVVTGYILIVISAGMAIISFASMNGKNPFNGFALSMAFAFIGLIFALFRSILIIDEKSGYVIKESKLAGMRLSGERVRIPQHCIRLIIKEKFKVGTGYYRFVLPVNYYFRSYDMFFQSEKGLVRLINTDYQRAISIAEFLKSCIKLDYALEN
jgi:hypothetical protein